MSQENVEVVKAFFEAWNAEDMDALRDADTWEWISDFIDAADRVAVRVIWRGAGSGPDANVEMTDVFVVRKGKIFGLECFWDHAEALEVLGLSE